MTSKDNKIKVEDYGDILAFRYEGEKVYFSEEGGSYQGEYVAVIKAEKELGYSDDNKAKQYYVFVSSYGSCSGCDWLEAVGETDWESEDYEIFVDVKEALEYANQTEPLYILPNKPTKKWVNDLAKKANS